MGCNPTGFIAEVVRRGGWMSEKIRQRESVYGVNTP